jgi:hypothetical protein
VYPRDIERIDAAIRLCSDRFPSGSSRFRESGLKPIHFRVQLSPFGAPSFGGRLQFCFEQRTLTIGFAKFRIELTLGFFDRLSSRTVLVHLPKYNKAA